MSVGGHSGYFHVLAIVNSAVMNTEVHVSFQKFIFNGKIIALHVVLVFAIHQHESAMGMYHRVHMSPPS